MILKNSQTAAEFHKKVIPQTMTQFYLTFPCEKRFWYLFVFTMREFNKRSLLGKSFILLHEGEIAQQQKMWSKNYTVQRKYMLCFEKKSPVFIARNHFPNIFWDIPFLRGAKFHHVKRIIQSLFQKHFLHPVTTGENGSFC